MANKVLIFPETKYAEAEAYGVVAEAAWRQITGNPNAGWTYIREDAFGQFVVPLLAAPQAWNGVEIVEPAECIAARADGVIHDSYVAPPTEEEE